MDSHWHAHPLSRSPFISELCQSADTPDCRLSVSSLTFGLRACAWNTNCFTFENKTLCPQWCWATAPVGLTQPPHRFGKIIPFCCFSAQAGPEGSRVPYAHTLDPGAEWEEKSSPATALDRTDLECNKTCAHMFHYVNKADLGGLLQTHSEPKSSWLYLVHKSQCDSGCQFRVFSEPIAPYVFYLLT